MKIWWIPWNIIEIWWKSLKYQWNLGLKLARNLRESMTSDRNQWRFDEFIKISLTSDETHWNLMNSCWLEILENHWNLIEISEDLMNSLKNHWNLFELIENHWTLIEINDISAEHARNKSSSRRRSWKYITTFQLRSL